MKLTRRGFLAGAGAVAAGSAAWGLDPNRAWADEEAAEEAAGTDEAVAAGFDAGAIIKAMGPAIQGGGGGKPTMAQAGGKNPDGIDEALEIARNMIL